MRYLSPLRYPGGKARLASFFATLIEAQVPRPTRYAEPFAGGAGAALRLLTDGVVTDVLINDINPGIAAFWRSVTCRTESFVRLIDTTPVTIEQWHAASERYSEGSVGDDLSLGFATFFLNRTNRSGILDARPIGGLDQNGKWKIDARYNKTALIERVRAVGDLAGHITVSQLDGIDFLETLDRVGDDVFVYADPPYVVQGKELYLDAFDDHDHRDLADSLLHAHYRWVLTYDDDRLIWNELYSGERCARFDIAHTAQINHRGTETVVYGPGLEVPHDIEVTRGVQASWIETASLRLN